MTFGPAKAESMRNQTHVSTYIMKTYEYTIPKYIIIDKSCGCGLYKLGKHKIKAYDIAFCFMKLHIYFSR